MAATRRKIGSPPPEKLEARQRRSWILMACGLAISTSAIVIILIGPQFRLYAYITLALGFCVSLVGKLIARGEVG